MSFFDKIEDVTIVDMFKWVGWHKTTRQTVLSSVADKSRTVTKWTGHWLAGTCLTL